MGRMVVGAERVCIDGIKLVSPFLRPAYVCEESAISPSFAQLPEQCVSFRRGVQPITEACTGYRRPIARHDEICGIDPEFPCLAFPLFLTLSVLQQEPFDNLGSQKANGWAIRFVGEIEWYQAFRVVCSIGEAGSVAHDAHIVA